MWLHYGISHCEDGNECLLIFMLHIICIHVGTSLISLEYASHSPSHHALPQSTISVSQVFILLVTFFLIHHIFWVNVAHLPSVAKHRSSLQILFTKKYSPLLVNQVEYIGLPDIILLVLDTRIEGMY